MSINYKKDYKEKILVNDEGKCTLYKVYLTTGMDPSEELKVDLNKDFYSGTIEDAFCTFIKTHYSEDELPLDFEYAIVCIEMDYDVFEKAANHTITKAENDMDTFVLKDDNFDKYKFTISLDEAVFSTSIKPCTIENIVYKHNADSDEIVIEELKLDTIEAI